MSSFSSASSNKAARDQINCAAINAALVAARQIAKDESIQKDIFIGAIEGNNITTKELIRLAMRCEDKFKIAIQNFLFIEMRNSIEVSEKSKKEKKERAASEKSDEGKAALNILNLGVWGDHSSDDETSESSGCSSAPSSPKPTPRLSDAAPRPLPPRRQNKGPASLNNYIKSSPPAAPRSNQNSKGAARNMSSEPKVKIANPNPLATNSKTSLWSFVGISRERMAKANFNDWFAEYDGGEPIGWVYHREDSTFSCEPSSGYRHHQEADGKWKHLWIENGVWVPTTAERIAEELIARKPRKISRNSARRD